MGALRVAPCAAPRAPAAERASTLERRELACDERAGTGRKHAQPFDGGGRVVLIAEYRLHPLERARQLLGTAARE